MPIPSAENENLRHEMRKMLHRKNNKNRLHKIQKNVQVYDIGMPLLAALERVSAGSSLSCNSSDSDLLIISPGRQG